LRNWHKTFLATPTQITERKVPEEEEDTAKGKKRRRR
jgi:hypothetical protein